jgi:hypothetical protein
MATLGSRLKTKQMPWHANMTELNHLGAALIAKPHVFEGKMNQLFSAQNYYSDNPLSSIAWKTGAEKVLNTMEWEWQLKGATEQPLVVLENIEAATYPGQFKTPFKIKLDKNWYQPGDVITPGTAGQKFQCRIMEEVERHGNGWAYTVRLVSDNPQDYVPTAYLAAGQQWAKMYSTYEEGANQDGSTQYSMPLSLKDSMGKFRKKYQVTDYASEEVLAVKMQDTKGNMHDSWIKYAEVEYWQQWYRELERAFWYNRSARSIEGSTGRAVDTFSGVQEKLEDSHIHYYTSLTAKLIEEFLLDIFYSRVKPGSGRKIKVFTGEYGMVLFNRAMQDIMDKRGWIIANQNFSPVQNAKSEYHSNAYSVGYQFVQYKMHNGAELELVHNPLYDDRSINFEIDPITGFPTESMRFTFLDFSGDSGSSNVQLMSKKDGYKFGYVAGLVSPYGPAQGNMMSHSGEYYSMHVSKVCGVHIEDITKCGELILKRNVA